MPFENQDGNTDVFKKQITHGMRTLSMALETVLFSRRVCLMRFT